MTERSALSTGIMLFTRHSHSVWALKNLVKAHQNDGRDANPEAHFAELRVAPLYPPQFMIRHWYESHQTSDCEPSRHGTIPHSLGQQNDDGAETEESRNANGRRYLFPHHARIDSNYISLYGSLVSGCGPRVKQQSACSEDDVSSYDERTCDSIAEPHDAACLAPRSSLDSAEPSFVPGCNLFYWNPAKNCLVKVVETRGYIQQLRGFSNDKSPVNAKDPAGKRMAG